MSTVPTRSSGGNVPVDAAELATVQEIARRVMRGEPYPAVAADMRARGIEVPPFIRISTRTADGCRVEYAEPLGQG